MRFFHLLFLLSCLILLSNTSASDIKEGEIMIDQKTQFPEVIGWTGEDAKADLEAKFPDFEIVVVPWDAMLTMDWREDRIRIMVDENGMVKKAPRIG